MAFEVGDKKKLIFVIWLVVLVGLATYVWYPRVFGKKPSVRRAQVLEQPPLLIEVAPSKPEKPAVQPRPETKPTPPPPPTAKVAKEAPKAEAVPAPARPRGYGLEFPPFVTLAEADEHQRRLKEAGLPTVRATTFLDDGLYTLVIGPFPDAAKAGGVMAELRAKPPGGSPKEAEGGFVFSDGPYVLREVVQRAQEMRGKGYGVRIIIAEGKVPLYIVRTEARLDSAQAEKLSGHYRKLGFPNRVARGR